MLERRQFLIAACAPCHAAGPGHPGTVALALKYMGQEPPVLTNRPDLDADTIGYVVRNGVNAMPFFRKTEISDAELRSIEDFLTKHASKAGK